MIMDREERDGNDIIIRFDSLQSQVIDAIVRSPEARYELEIRPDEPDMEDGVIITANRAACLALSRIFGQLALCDIPEGESIRIGWDETDAVGVRIVLDESGRMDGCADDE